MPPRQTKYGAECPLNKFEIDIPAGAGCYTSDPVVACIDCFFGDLTEEGFDLEKICQCPGEMTLEDYNRSKKEYIEIQEKNKEQLTRAGFWNYAKQHLKTN